MSKVYTQTDLAADLGEIQACSSSSLATTTKAWKAVEGGTAGATEVSVGDVGAGTQRSFAMFEITPAAGVIWDAGDWVVRINLTTSHMSQNWDDTYICRVSSGGVNQETIGSLTNQAIDASTTGVKTMTVSGSAVTPDSGDKVYIVLVFNSDGAGGNQSVGITPDQNIDTPLVEDTGGSVGVSPAGSTFGAVALTVALGAATVSPQPAAATFAAQPITTAVAQTVEVAAAAATFTSTATSPSLGPVAVGVAPGTATWAATAPTLSLGAAFVDVAPAAATWAATAVSISQGQGVAVSPASTAWSATAATTSVGAFSVAVAPSIATWSATALTISEAQSVAVAPAGASFAATPTTVSLGAVTAQVSPATATFSATAATKSVGAFSVAISPSIATWSATTLTIREAQSVAVAPAGATLAATPTTVSLGAVTAQASPATATWSAATIGVVVPIPDLATLELFVGGGWVDVTDDVVPEEPIGGSYGIFGSGPLDLQARPLSLSLALDNGPTNSAGLRGYYSLNHPNQRPGFQQNIPVRFRMYAQDGTTKTITGKLEDAVPTPGLRGGMVTHIEVTSWLKGFLELTDLQLSLQQNKRADELLDALVALADEAPAAKDFDLGTDTYKFAYDDVGSDPSTRPVVQRVLQSELGKFFERHIDAAGETLCFRNRSASLLGSPADTFDANELLADGPILQVPSSRERIHNDIEVVGYPRRVGSSDQEVLIKLDAAVKVDDGKTEKLFADYRDPNNEAERVGGTDLQPISDGTGADPTVDWTANTAEDGSGTDVTANVAVTATYFGSSALIEITNSSGGTAYIRGPGSEDGLQARGRGLYRYKPIEVRSDPDADEVAESISKFGSRPLPAPLDMPYQGNREILKQIADRVARQYGGVGNVPTRLEIIAIDQDMLARVLSRDIGDQITILEEQTAVTADVEINAYEFEIRDNVPRFWWTTAPTDPTAAFIFNDPVLGVFGDNAFGYA